jgi:molybdate transport system substrate-binding protein
VEIITTFSGSIAATSDHPEAMQALLAFWVSAACTPLKLQHGMQTA